VVLTAPPAQAVDAPGPYYAEPAWDQILPVETRFVVLTNWGSKAVLDKETGLVWERSPNVIPQTWFGARSICTGRRTGNRIGWRLPSMPELASLVDSNNSHPVLPTSHPFTGVQTSFPYWSATTNAEFPTFAWVVNFNNGVVGNHFFDKTSEIFTWCVRGGMNADQY
jgi:hypothetical protein